MSLLIYLQSTLLDTFQKWDILAGYKEQQTMPEETSNEITPELFRHLVHLAALELDPQESEYLRQQLNNQLKAIHELEAIPLDTQTQVTSHGVPYTAETRPASRDDQWIPYTRTEDILSQAPETEDRYIVVPDIPHTELE